MRGGEGFYGRPRPVHRTDILETTPLPRATLKALPTPHPPPSPLQINRLSVTHAQGCGCCFINGIERGGTHKLILAS